MPLPGLMAAIALTCRRWLLFACLLAGSSAWAQIAGAPFTCDVVFYQMRNIGAQSLPIKFQAVSDTVTPTAVYTTIQGTPINSIGYNPVDNYIYGLRAAAVQPQLYRIGQSGYELVGTIQTTAVGGTAFTAAFTPTGAVFDAAGRFYFVGQGAGNITPPAIYRVDSIPLSGTVEVAHIYNLDTVPTVNFGDFDFNGAGGPAGLLLGSTGTNHYRLQLIPNGTTPALGTAAVTVSTIADVGAVGSAFYDAFTGRFFVFNNTNNDFWQITNPDFGVPGTVLTNAVVYSGPPAFGPNYSPTDGTSCPISGVRRADLGIVKSDNRGTVTAGGVTAYTITVTNAGPYPANYAVVRDPPAPGVQKLSVSCSAPGGPPRAVCPGTLNTSTFETGVQILTFPPGTTLVFTLNAQITGAVGSLVTNTATVTPALDTVDPTLTNNVSVDVNAVAGTTTTVVSGAQQCPAGTVQSTINRLVNGDFAAAAPFASEATIGALNTYGAANYVARQTGTQSYLPVAPPPSGVVQNAFPGDPARSIPGGDSWLLSNGKAAAANYRVWTQGVTGLTVGRVHQVMMYVSNATRPASATTNARLGWLRSKL